MALIHAFGPFQVDAEAEILFRGTEPLPVGRRAVVLLRVLVERPGAPVSKDALIEAAWSGLAVEESNLPVQIAALRKVLGQEPGGERWIETLPRRGYRFVGPTPIAMENGVPVGLPPAARGDAATPPRTEPERRQLSVMSCELVGSRLELEAMRDAMQAFQGCVAEIVGRFHGFVAKRVGNTVVAYFGHPVAHEDEVEQAVHAGLALCAAVQALEIAAKVPLQCRVGIATGLSIVDETLDRAVVGEASGVSIRLQMAAPDGGVVIDEATRRLVGRLFECRELGTIEVGAGHAEPACHVVRASSIKSRFESLHATALTPFVGRGRELDALAGWRREASDRLCVVDIIGDPGIGKSRLLHEFRRRLIDDGVLVLSGNCWPDGQQTSFRPFIEIVRRVFRLDPSESEAEAARKLDAGLTFVGLATPENIGLLMNLLGLAPPASTLAGLDGVLIGLRTRSLLLDLLRERRRMTPVAVLLEDLHWIDRASQELLGRLIAAADAPPLLIVNTYRPSHQPPWLGHAGATVHRLAPLSSDDTAQIAAIRLGSAHADTALVRLIVEKAEGNPLFAEEIANFLIERGLEQQDDTAVAGGAAVAPLPPSVQSLLMARVDRLGSADRVLLQAASVVGRRFRVDLLAQATDVQNLDTRLSAMEALDLIHVDRASGEFVFKHALVCDALYSGLLSGPRAALHLRIAREIERRNPDRPTEVAETLAHHFSRTDQTEKSVEYLALSGRKSFGVYSLDAAEHYLKSAIALARSQDPARMDVRIATVMMDLVKVLYLQSRSQETIALVEPELQRIDLLGDIEPVVILLDLYAISLFTGCRFHEARRIEEKALAMAQRLGDERAQAYARAGLIMLSIVTDAKPLEGFDDLAESAYAKAAAHGDVYIIGRTVMAIVWYYIHLGLVLEGQRWVDRLMTFGRERQDPRALGIALWLLGWIEYIGQDYAAALHHGEECMRIAITPLDRQVGQSVVGNCQLLLGRVAEGSETIRRHRQQAEANGWLYSALPGEVAVAASMLLRGELAKGVRRLESAIERLESQYKYRMYSDMARIYLAEFYILLLRGARKPSLRTIVKNLLFLVRAKRVAAGQAEALLRYAITDPWFSDRGVARARIEFDLGELCAVTGRLDQAHAHFEKARNIAVPQEVPKMLARIDAAISSNHAAKSAALAPDGRRLCRPKPPVTTGRDTDPKSSKMP